MRGCCAASVSNPRLTRADERVVSALLPAGTRPLSSGSDSSLIRRHSVRYGGEAFSSGVDVALDSRDDILNQISPRILCLCLFSPEVVEIGCAQLLRLSLDFDEPSLDLSNLTDCAISSGPTPSPSTDSGL